MKTLRKYATIARISVTNAFVYRSSVLSGLVFYTMFIFVFLNLWRAIYRGGELEGYTLVHMVWYLCMTELVAFGTRSGVFGQMNADVKSGAIAYQLNRPYHYVFYTFVNALGGMAFNFLAFGALALVLGFVMVGPIPGFQPLMLPFALFSMGLGISLNFFLQMTLGLTAFRLEENTAFYLIYQKLVFMLGMFMPVEFLPGVLQNIARALPFSYVCWAPARLVVSFSWGMFWQVVPLQLVWLAVAVTLSLLMYGYGVRGIQAHGG